MMTPPSFALYIACLLMVNAAPEKTSGRSSFESVNVGVSVTLPCKCQEKSTVMLYWYKKPLGQTPQLMCLYYQHKNDATFYGQFKGERFSLDTEDQKHHLTISDFGISDSATYFCLGSTLYVVEFCESITVSAKGLDSDVQAVIHQSESESTQIDDTLTVTCAVHAATCDGEHNVYWFKDSEETQPGLIYTHGGRNDQCERKPNSQSNTCAYNLPMQDVDPAHDGNYCTVASCGHVLFGKGTTLDSEGESSALVFILSALLAVTVLLITSLAVSLYRKKSRHYQCAAAHSSPATASCDDAENLHYAALSVHRADRSRRLREDQTTDCVYSSVRQ